MRVRGEIHEALKHSALTRAQARSAGVTGAQWRHPALVRPFHGVVSVADGSVAQRAAAYALRMPDPQFFSHSTAAVLHGVPLPHHLETAQTLHVSAAPGGGFPRGRGVRGHHSAWDRSPALYDGLRMSRPVDVWCELWGELGVDDLVAAGDYLVTGEEPYSGAPPLTTMGALHDSVAAYGGRRGAKKLRAALELVRYGALSRMETKTRLLLAGAGLPEPELNYSVFDSDGTRVAMLDLCYPEFKVAIEYQSDYHSGGAQYRKDVTRRERLEDLGWTVIFVSADDIRLRPLETASRVRLRLHARGAAASTRHTPSSRLHVSTL